MATLYSESVTSTAYKVTRAATGVKCDVCGKVIPVIFGWHRGHDDRYYEIVTGHHDWGNDSFESVETRDVCQECAPKFIKDYMAGCLGSNTAYIEIRNRTAYAKEISTVVDTPPKEGEVYVEGHDSW